MSKCNWISKCLLALSLCILFCYSSSYAALPASLSTVGNAPGWSPARVCRKLLPEFNKSATATNAVAKQYNQLMAKRSKLGKQYQKEKSKLKKFQKTKGPLKAINQTALNIQNIEQRNNDILQQLERLNKKYNDLNNEFQTINDKMKDCNNKVACDPTIGLSLKRITKYCPECKHEVEDYNDLVSDYYAQAEKVKNVCIQIKNILAKSDRINAAIARAGKGEGSKVLRDKLHAQQNKLMQSSKQWGKYSKDYRAKLWDIYKKAKDARKDALNCLKTDCKKKHAMVTPPNVSIGGTINPQALAAVNTPHSPAPVNTTGNIPGFSIGIAGEVATSGRNTSVKHVVNTQRETSRDHKRITGFGAALIVQYYLSHPAWFIFGSFDYPGDHKGTVTDNSGVPIPISLTTSITKQWALTFGLARQLLAFHYFNLSLGAGLTVLSQKTELDLGTLPNPTIDSNTQRSATATMMVEALMPLTAHLQFMLMYQLTYLPSTSFQANLNGFNPFNTKVGSGFENSFMFGLKISLASLMNRSQTAR